MARAATTTDAFNAVAEPRRREILDALARGERSVTDLVEQLGVAQPVVSKHLRVYRLEAAPLRAVYEWVKDYEQLWTERFELLDAVLEDLEAQQAELGRHGSQPAESKTTDKERE
jgi:DNA-binding transcriptional ArsR family regulator